MIRAKPRRAMTIAVGMGIALIGVCPLAMAQTGYDVTQGGSALGTIIPFASSQTAADFYKDNAWRQNPPTLPLASNSTVLYVHYNETSGEHTLGWVHGKTLSGVAGRLDGTVEVADDVASPTVIFSDEPDEFGPRPGTPRTFDGAWQWASMPDGGVVPVGTTPGQGGAIVTITDYGPWSTRYYPGLECDAWEWYVASGDSSMIELEMGTNNAVTLTAHASTPELPPFALASLALPLGWLRWKLRRNKKK